MEIKTGYGLSVDSETELASLAAEATPEATFLGAHLVPGEYQGRADDYVELVCGPMLAAVRDRRPLDRRVLRDRSLRRRPVPGPCSPPAGTPGWAFGSTPTSSATGPACNSAVEMGCASVDHCTYLSDDDIEALAVQRHRGHVPARHRLLHPPALPRRPAGPRRRRPGGHRLELQPRVELHHPRCRSAWRMAVRDMGMTIDEAVAAVTTGGAAALRRDDVGRISARRPRRR